MNKVRICARLYHELYSTEYGDRLIAIYCLLKFHKSQRERFLSRKSGKRTLSGYSLLRSETNIPLDTLKKYVPVLIQMGLCNFTDQGDFFMLGNDKIKALYSCEKLVPIQIGRNMIETSYFVYMVRIYSSIRRQNKVIADKNKKSVILNKKKNGEYLDKSEIKTLKFIKTDEIEVQSVGTLSNEGFGRIKSGSRFSKPQGYYWKSKLRRKNLIDSERRFNQMSEVPFWAFEDIKKRRLAGKRFVFVNGVFCEELSSIITII